jgi:stress response protein YsnF
MATVPKDRVDTNRVPMGTTAKADINRANMATITKGDTSRVPMETMAKADINRDSTVTGRVGISRASMATTTGASRTARAGSVQGRADRDLVTGLDLAADPDRVVAGLPVA